MVETDMKHMTPNNVCVCIGVCGCVCECVMSQPPD